MTALPVMHLLNSFGDSSISRIVLRLLRDLGTEKYRWSVLALAPDGDMAEIYRGLGADVISVNPAGNPWQQAEEIRQYVQANSVRIVQSHTPRTALAAYLALLKRKETIHLATKHLFYRSSDRKFGLAYTALDRLSLYLAAHVVAVSEEMQDRIAGYPGMSASRISAIPNAIDCAAYGKTSNSAVCRAALGIEPEAFVAGYTGRIDRVKRLDLLLQAFKRVLTDCPQARLLIVGDGELRNEMQRLARTLVGDAAIFTGFRKDIPELLGTMNVYVQTSGNEGLSLSMIEAMASGLPVVTTPAGGVRELINSGKSGLVVPPNADIIGNAILKLFQDQAYAKDIGKKAQSYVRIHYDVRRQIRQYATLYARLSFE